MKLSYLIVLLASFAQNTKIYNQFVVVHPPICLHFISEIAHCWSAPKVVM